MMCLLHNAVVIPFCSSLQCLQQEGIRRRVYQKLLHRPHWLHLRHISISELDWFELDFAAFLTVASGLPFLRWSLLPPANPLMGLSWWRDMDALDRDCQRVRQWCTPQIIQLNHWKGQKRPSKCLFWRASAIITLHNSVVEAEMVWSTHAKAALALE